MMNDKGQEYARLSMRLMEAAAYPIPEWGEVVCRLWRMTPNARGASPSVTYAIEMTGLGMRRMYCLSGDGRRATEIFRLLVRNTVTPCGLADVLEELEVED